MMREVVVLRRAALLEIVGDCGYYVDDLDPEAVGAKIKVQKG